MEDVLDPVYDNGSVTFDHIEDSLNSQEIFTPKYNQRLKPGIQRIAEDWLIDRQANRLYMRIVPIDVIMIVRVVVAHVLMIMIVVVMIVRLRVSFRLEPILHVETFRFRIVKTRIEQRIWINSTFDSDDLRRGTRASDTAEEDVVACHVGDRLWIYDLAISDSPSLLSRLL